MAQAVRENEKVQRYFGAQECDGRKTDLFTSLSDFVTELGKAIKELQAEKRPASTPRVPVLTPWWGQ